MNNTYVYLSRKIFKHDIDQVPTRNGYGLGLLAAGKKDKRVVVLCADLTDSTRSSYFKKEFPDRFIEVGVAEQLLATVASGMAAYGKIPFIASYAAFSPGRNLEQIRTTIALNDVPVKIAGCHAGVSVGPDGATHQALEDIACMRALPNMTVIYPCDVLEAQKATFAAAFTKKPVYLRFAREKTPVFTTKKTPFQIGKANVFVKGTDVTLIGAGPLLYEALLASRELQKQGISAEVINMHTIKPLDKTTLVRSVKKTGAVVSIEEHQIIGGLGGALAELFSKKFPAPQEYIGMDDRFGESGKPDKLLEKFAMSASDIVLAAQRVIRRKRI